MSRLLCALLLTACVTNARSPYDKTDYKLTLYISSVSWHVTALDIYCHRSGGLLTTIRGIDLGTNMRRRMDIGNCRTVLVRIRLRGGRTHTMHEHASMVDPGGALCIQLENNPAHSRAWPCTRRT